MTAKPRVETGWTGRLLTLLAAWIGLGLLALQLPAPTPATSLSASASLRETPSLAVTPRTALADVRDTGRLPNLRDVPSHEDRPGLDGAVGLGASPTLRPPHTYVAQSFGLEAQPASRQRAWQGVRARAPPLIA